MSGDIIYGNVTQLANVDRLDSIANNQARAFGFIDNTTVRAIEYLIMLEIDLETGATGNLDVYLVESINNSIWTDGINPDTETADVAARLGNSPVIALNVDATYHGTNRPFVRHYFGIGDHVNTAPPFFGFVVVNQSGVALGTLNDGFYATVKVDT